MQDCSLKKNRSRHTVFFIALATFTFLAAGVTAAQQTTAPQSQPAASQPKTQAPAAASSAAQTPATQPSPADSADRDKAIVLHLNAVLRFYHDASAPTIQKVGEPSDLIYRDQVLTLATQIAGYAFQSAKAEAALMAKPSPQGAAAGPSPAAGQTQAQRLQATRDSVTQRIAQLKAQDTDLDTKLASARPRDVAALQEQRQQTEGELELQTAMQDALEKITKVSGISNETGFLAQIEQLERSAPGLMSGKPTTVAPTLESLSAARSAGVSSQARVLFDLLGTRQSIEELIKETNDLHQQALDVRTPLVNILRSTIAEGETLSQQASGAATPVAMANPPSVTTPPPPSSLAPTGSAAPVSSALTLAATRKSFDSLTATFKQISGATIPLSQEVMALEQSHASLNAWKSAVDAEYASILHSLLLRVLGIAIALAVIFVLGEVWRRATTRYVKDIRRRRQLLVVRRLAIGFLSGLVMIFGLVTQFSSLATFAGFITAGLAVGLQTILLSVAAYFFIIGRYGVKVGDRITVAGVTGDVAEVGLVRFYMLELAGSGTDLYPSGRVAVFSNAVLFQAGTPLYKQLPGTEYLWHEMTVKLNQESDYQPAIDAMLKTVQGVYEQYRKQIERQHQVVESWMDTSLDIPGVQSSLQLVDGGPQFWARFPVLIRQTTETDNRMTEALLKTIASDPKVKAAVISAPIVKAAVKG
jgi:small-conductance mechanosensitive channel